MVKKIVHLLRTQRPAFSKKEREVFLIVQVWVVRHDFKQALKGPAHGGARFQFEDIHYVMPVQGKITGGKSLSFPDD